MAASTENVTLSPLLDTIDILNGTNTTQKEVFVASTEGMLLSYSFLLLSALLCVYFGSYRSITRKDKQKESGEKPDVLTAKDAAMFPFIASGFLFGIYVVILLVSKEYITFVLNIYFFLIGIVALFRAIQPVLVKIRLPALNKLRERQFHITLSENKPPNTTTETTTTTTVKDLMHLDFTFDLVDVGALFLCVLVGVWYLLKRHWMANNIFGIAFSINAIEILHFNKVLNGVVLLSGLFVYDIFWVFGTNVMITVAKSFDAPIKLLFPQDLIENGLLAANKFAMLGLGDIVVPGAFIALLLRYDMSRRPGSSRYFTVSFLAYIIALVITILILQLFKHAQPALLYIVPLCLIFPIVTALICKDWTTMFAYEDHATEKKNE
jgi:minor histocompatibility antigen H13